MGGEEEGRGTAYRVLLLAGGSRLVLLGFGLLRGTLFVRFGWVWYGFVLVRLGCGFCGWV